jgi:hypothetical protein
MDGARGATTTRDGWMEGWMDEGMNIKKASKQLLFLLLLFQCK